MTAERVHSVELRSIGFLFLASILYSAALCTDIQALEIGATVTYVLVSSVYFFKLGKRLIGGEHVAGWFLPLLVASAPIGIFLPAWISGHAESFFFVSDSIATHVPGAARFAAALSGKDPLTLDLLQSQGPLTHFWVGLFFLVFGKTPTASLIALTIVKIGTCILIGNFAVGWLGEKSNKSSYVVYLGAPNVLFYTATFYKEAIVHLLIAGALTSIQKFWRRPGLWAALGFALALAGLFLERFYLGLLLTPFLPLLAVLALKRRAFVPGVLMVIGLVAAFYFQPYLRFSPERIVQTLREFRDGHRALEGIRTEYNYEINYGLAVIKTVLTPIWSPDKINLFRGFSAILTWGSVIHQLIMLAYFMGVFRAVKTQGYKHLVIQIPFFAFILLTAYISPWAGRIRDSFYPLVAAYAFFYLADFARQDLASLSGRLRMRFKA